MRVAITCNVKPPDAVGYRVGVGDDGSAVGGAAAEVGCVEGASCDIAVDISAATGSVGMAAGAGVVGGAAAEAGLRPIDADAELDEPETIAAIQAALEAGGHEVYVLEADASLIQHLIESPPDIVFNIAEGSRGRGREAHVPALLSFLGIPYTGSDETTMCVTLDKALSKAVLAPYGVAAPRHMMASGPVGSLAEGMAYPVIIKPVAEGSSMGITRQSVVYDDESLDAILAAAVALYGQEMLIEQFIAGREFTVGVLGNGPEMRVFEPMELLFADAAQGIYSYEVKQDFKRYVSYACPPDIPPGLSEHMRQTAATAYQALRCLDMARFDFRLSPDGELYFIEVNALPGLAPGYSDYPMLAEFNGVGYDELIRAVLDSALKRYGM